jgi:hypothetical protein
MPIEMAKAVGIDSRHMPRDADLSRLFEGRRADTGEAWSKHPRKLSGFDLVFSPDKSVTLAAEFALSERAVVELLRRKLAKPRSGIAWAQGHSFIVRRQSGWMPATIRMDAAAGRPKVRCSLAVG